MPPRFTDEDRRARLVTRHHLARTATSVGRAVQDVVAFHSSDPATPYLAAWARVGSFLASDLDRALYDERGLWRLHAMRRTLFVVPTELAAVFDGGAGRAVAAKERRRLEQWLEGVVDDPARWLADLESRVLAVFGDGLDYRTTELADAVPELAREITVGSGKWSGTVPLSSRLLYLLAMELKLVRARAAGTWRSSQYRWAAADRWFGKSIEPVEPEQGRAELLTLYLRAFGPATMTDMRWWTGWTVRDTRAALEAVGAVEAELSGSAVGYVLADDRDSNDNPEGVVTLLPGLDSTPMGWKERTWFLGDHAGPLYDRNGNIGPTVWVDGRIVGGWGQRPDGEVAVRLLEEVGKQATAMIDSEAAALTLWLDGTVVTPRFRTPLERELSS
ncbi:MAG: winged helix DNA-binding domain-containing protein [Acidimicrobiia bacterium]|nr:winged helix DNA-binding domain-containing protein [Acidimicrobiia bacterium]